MVSAHRISILKLGLSAALFACAAGFAEQDSHDTPASGSANLRQSLIQTVGEGNADKVDEFLRINAAKVRELPQDQVSEFLDNVSNGTQFVSTVESCVDHACRYHGTVGGNLAEDWSCFWDGCVHGCDFNARHCKY